MEQRVFRAARLTLLLLFFALLGGLLWCIWFTGSLSVTFAIFVLITSIIIFTRERLAVICRQSLILEADSLIYFDGQTRHEFHFADIKKIRVGRWVGNFRAGQNAGHSLGLVPQNDRKITYWDLSDFSLRVVLRITCEITRRADCPVIEIHQTEFQNLKAELSSAARDLGTLAPIALDAVDEESLSFYAKEFRKRERRYLFTPHS